MAPRPVVVKFGGAALELPGLAVRHVVQLREQGLRVAVVVSARRGVTDLLNQLVNQRTSRAARRRVLRRIAARHPNLPPSGVACLRHLGVLADQVSKRYARDRPIADRLLSQGERLAAHWLAGRLADAGVSARALDADHLGILTDNSYGRSEILLGLSAPGIRAGLGRVWRAGRVPVVTGFFGRSLEGRVATLGRGGSDYSASAIGASVGARWVELVKRSVCVFTGDPRKIPFARPIPRLSYPQAETIARLGAGVLHPRTIGPAREAGIELRVTALSRPDLKTRIAERGGSRVRAIVISPPLDLWRVSGSTAHDGRVPLADLKKHLARLPTPPVLLFGTGSGVFLAGSRPPAASGAPHACAGSRGTGVRFLSEGSVVLVHLVSPSAIADARKVPRTLLRGCLALVASAHTATFVVPAERGLRTARAVHRALVERGT